MPESGSQYIHGTAPEEQFRLSRLNDLLNEATLREMAPKSGERVVDFGSGLAQLTRAIARTTGTPAVGIERSREQIAEALRQAREAGEEALVDLRAGDVLDPPLAANEWNTFDLAHARFVLEHVPDPLAVVKQMVRAVRPGGRIVLADDDHDLLRMWPEPPGFMTVWGAYVRTYDRAGNDPYVGRRLVQLLHAAGASPVRNTQIFFGSCSGQRSFTAFVENVAGILEGAREAILSVGALDPVYFEDAVAALRGWGERPDGALWFGMSWAEGVKRG